VTTLLICAGAPHTRRALQRCAAGVPGLDQVCCAADAAGAREWVRRQAPDAVLLDAQLPGAGPDTVGELVAGEPRPGVLMFGSLPDYGAMAEALAAGASGFLRPDVSSAELAAALAHALAGRGPGGRTTPAGVATPAGIAAAPPLPRPGLTEREVQVLRGMSEGKSNGQIGRGLYLSEDTVKTHAQRLFRKLGVNDRAHAVASGFRLGLVS
jgi:DNA-binding NarL/FixJ family response regulator